MIKNNIEKNRSIQRDTTGVSLDQSIEADLMDMVGEMDFPVRQNS